ncbi:MAG: teichoic acid transporter permease [Burkholderiales bacterium]|jgi:teichoic acid transport system permease protein|nr:teichoic acid transporter permease [Burkholderiales bacterium]
MNFFISILNNRKVLLNLIRSDFKNRYLGNHLGIVWAFIQPLVMIAVYWFVFTYGLRTGKVDDAPFLIWLMAGLVPWFLLNDAILSASRAILDQSFLVKKIVFEVKLLPIIKIGSAVMVNIAFWIFLLVCLLAYGYYPNLMWVQVIYFVICIISFTLSLSLLLSSLMVFMQDIAQVVNIFLQILFWATPIMWNQKLIPHKLIWIIKLNPFAYIIDGVRDALIYKLPFWVHYNTTIYFWVVTVFIFFIGNKVFNNLRPHFADVL